MEYKHWGIAIAVILLYGCGYDDFDDPGLRHREAEGMNANITIKDVTSRYAGRVIDITEDAVIAGYVTTSDVSGNFYRSFFIDDATGAVEIKAGLYDLYNIYPVGLRVAVRLKGLRLGEDKGVKQIGLKARVAGVEQAGYFNYRYEANKYLLRDTIRTAPKPLTKTIASLKMEDCGRLVAVGSLTLKNDQPEYWTAAGINPYETSAFRKFCDPHGDSIAVLTSVYANFACQPIPQGALSLTGILHFGNVSGGKQMYYLKIRDLTDVM